jgi:hypothetical protein
MIYNPHIQQYGDWGKRCREHVTHMVEHRNTCRVWMEKPEEK